MGDGIPQGQIFQDDILDAGALGHRREDGSLHVCGELIRFQPSSMSMPIVAIRGVASWMENRLDTEIVCCCQCQ
jgi:hypothetical protein